MPVQSPISTKTETINPHHKSFWDPGFFSRTNNTISIWIICSSWPYVFLTVEWRNKGRTQYQLLSSVDSTKISCICRGGAVHHLTVFCTQTTIFQSDQDFSTFIHPNTLLLHNQSGWLSRKASLFISVWKCQMYIIFFFFLSLECFSQNLAKYLPREGSRCCTWTTGSRAARGLGLELDCEGQSIATHPSTL